MRLGSATDHGTFIIQRLESIEELVALTPEWSVIDRATRPRSPFTSPAWLLPWWKHLRRRNVAFRDELYFHAIRSRDDRLVGVAPLMRSFAPGLGVPVLRILQFFGTDPGLTEFRGVICRNGDHDVVVQALFAHFLARRDEWDVFRWHGLRRSAADYEAVLPGDTLIGRAGLPDYVLVLPPSWEALMTRVSRNMRKNLRKAYEGLERDGLRFGLRVVAAEAEVADATARLLALHAARAAAAKMVKHPHLFRSRRTLAFLGEYLLGFAARDQLRIFELEVAGKVVASRLAFQLDDVLYLYFSGYDLVWRDYSVMTLLMAEMIQWALARGIREINLSTGNDQSKLRWKPEEVLLHEAVLISPSPRVRAAFWAYQRAADLRAALRP
jgi:CelD/BcsL family acetyltransferase involved in cellulose biosynthesis